LSLKGEDPCALQRAANEKNVEKVSGCRKGKWGKKLTVPCQRVNSKKQKGKKNPGAPRNVRGNAEKAKKKKKRGRKDLGTFEQNQNPRLGGFLAGMGKIDIARQTRLCAGEKCGPKDGRERAPAKIQIKRKRKTKRNKETNQKRKNH